MNSVLSIRLPMVRCGIAALAVMVVTAAPGCRSNGDRELLERELRCQEDRIYQLEDELDDLNYTLESARRENQALKKEIAGGDKGAGGRYVPSGSSPAATVPSVPDVEIPTLEAPEIEFVPKGSNGSRLNRVPSSSAPDLDEAPRFMPDLPEGAQKLRDAGSRLLQASSRTSALPEKSRNIMRLALNRQLTGGWNPDGRHGDEGVFVAFEPRDAQNKLVEAAGDVSIVVLDPAQLGAAARVARWDFTADEAQNHFHKGPLGKGMQFELPWPSDPPTSRDLRLYVRLTTIDGRNVETDARIRVSPPERWTKKTEVDNVDAEDDVDTEDDADDVLAETAEEDDAAPTLAVEDGEAEEVSEGPKLLPAEKGKGNAEPKRVARPKWSPNR